MMVLLWCVLILAWAKLGRTAPPLPASNASQATPLSSCLDTVLTLTQSCENDNKAYVTLMGHTSGFGSEFLAYLMNSLFTAMINNRRLVFLRSKRPWEYDCANKAAWGCYFTMGPCEDNLVDPAGIDLSKFMEYHRFPRDSGSEFIARESLINFQDQDVSHHLETVQNVIKEAYAEKIPEIASVCDVSAAQFKNNKNNGKFPVTTLAGLLANKLYQVTDEMQGYVDHANQFYYTSFSRRKVPLSPLRDSAKPQKLDKFAHHALGHSRGVPTKHITRPPLYHYAAIQLRLTDKKYETPDSVWPLISNMQIVARNVLLMLRDYQQYYPQHPPLTNIFIATDNCTAAGELAHYIRHTPVASLPAYRRVVPGFPVPPAATSPPPGSSDTSPDRFFFLGACFEADGATMVADKRNWNPRDEHGGNFVSPPPNVVRYLSAHGKTAASHNVTKPGAVPMAAEDHRPSANTQRVMADIDMLRHGAVFMGSFYSNLVRLVHYLRAPTQHQFSYHLLIDDKDFHDRDRMKNHF